LRATDKGEMADARTVEGTAHRDDDERWRLRAVSAPGIQGGWMEDGVGRLTSEGSQSQAVDPQQATQNSSRCQKVVTVDGVWFG
jgi:hypothetical protein